MTKAQSKRISQSQHLLAQEYGKHLMEQIKKDRKKIYETVTLPLVCGYVTFERLAPATILSSHTMKTNVSR